MIFSFEYREEKKNVSAECCIRPKEITFHALRSSVSIFKYGHFARRYYVQSLKTTIAENSFALEQGLARGPSKLVARSRNLFSAFNARPGWMHNSPARCVFRRKRREVAFTVEESSLSYFSNETRYRTGSRLSLFPSSLVSFTFHSYSIAGVH